MFFDKILPEGRELSQARNDRRHIFDDKVDLFLGIVDA